MSESRRILLEGAPRFSRAWLVSHAWILAGSILLAGGYNLFIIPHAVVPGGMPRRGEKREKEPSCHHAGLSRRRCVAARLGQPGRLRQTVAAGAVAGYSAATGCGSASATMSNMIRFSSKSFGV